ncbi:MAG TPA: PIG-L family deacetylase [Anaerolineales bacterium]|nr:PIG-L family deacetylase [Anaerolineales bacterium]
MRWIYLSPHLDDAILSAGGLIHGQSQDGIPVEIWTFMCGYPPEGEYSPIAHNLHKMWGFSTAVEVVRGRRVEDISAASMVGATTVHFDFLDCIYRRAPILDASFPIQEASGTIPDASLPPSEASGINAEWLYSEIFVPPHPADMDLPAQIAAEISARLKPDDVLVSQLSVGSHVDHVIVRQAAELLGRPLIYDIDVPYIFYKPEELELKAAGMKESVHLITETGLERWQEAVLAYKSQIPTLGDLFNTPEKVRESIKSYWSLHKGIRLLQPNYG